LHTVIPIILPATNECSGVASNNDSNSCINLKQWAVVSGSPSKSKLKLIKNE
jgi:hypothetical protein